MILNSIGKRLAASFGLVLCLLAGVAGIAWFALLQARTASDRMAQVALPLTLAIDELRTAQLSISVLVRDIVSHSDLAVQKQSRAALAQRSAGLDKAWADFGRLVSNDSDAVKALQEVQARQSNANAVLQRALDFVDKALYDEAAMVVYDELRPAQAGIAERLNTLQQNFVAQTKTEAADAARRNAASVLLILAATLAAMLLGIGASIWIARLITRPIAAAVKMAESVAGGNLNVEISGHSHDEVGRLLDSLRRMRDELAESVGAIRLSAEKVGTASKQIAAGNVEISSRTEEQASTLEQTAASMEEITATVKQSAQNAGQANQLSMGASDIAERGGQAMSEVVSTMHEISDASRKIVEIIAVIDGIAFQTNILALNAAVEAARAGDQGRGFAVVASEVRALAQRSTAAAKETKMLIQSSIERVDGGYKRVERAGEAMEEIVASAKRVTKIIAEISSASREQLSSISQVGSAVMQMERVTQQNAALVEESAAAAESMANEAQQLLRAVSRFKLNGIETSDVIMHGEHNIRAAPPTIDAAELTWPLRLDRQTAG